ncbi:MAG: aminoacyl-tRNA hydrolase [Alphaproteobacteria bacterium]|nr:aminoacyl-tRNA hydrolase [Alphaproteobacteria bacterium]
MQENKPILVVGLGNPGAEYARTRHNVGFMAVNALAAAAGAEWRIERNAQTARANIGGRTVIFMRPMTYMNNSGMAVGPCMNFYKIPTQNLIVIHDEMDLNLGVVRSKVGGGSAGHNGIRSIDSAVGPEYRRIRVGIGHPRELGLKISPADWVLAKMPDSDYDQICDAIKKINIKQYIGQ